jgi:hypothetical protein
MQYNRDIRPILAEKCFACHGPDSAARKADLRLDQADGAVSSGAITPGKPDQSELLKRIRLPDTDEMAMPPAKGHKRLTDSEKSSLERWIAEGAQYQAHWSLLPPQRPEPPSVENTQWSKNSLDLFVLAGLESRGLTPAPEADLRTLARRAALDITGLPPAVGDVEALVASDDPHAYEHYVDGLLQSDRWGEHRGRYWLDYARYADTHGIHFDNFREIWAYRDWVIDAFNRNLPFDEFTIEQLAGDLLPEATLDQRIASGFHRCNITTNEGGIIDEEYKVLYARDRTETTATVWMGLTAGCAVCHDHKFDPFTQRDFYALSAFFNNTTQPVRDGNVQNTPPIVVVPRREDRLRWKELDSAYQVATQNRDQAKQAAREEFKGKLASIKSTAVLQQIPNEGLSFHALLADGTGATTTVLAQGRLQIAKGATELNWATGQTAAAALQIGMPNVNSLEFPEEGDWEGDEAFTCAAWVWLPKKKQSGALVARMDDPQGYRGWDLWVENHKVGIHLINKFPDEGRWLKVVSKKELLPESWHHVAVTYDGSRKASGVKIYFDGLLQNERDEPATYVKGAVRTTVPLKIGQRHTNGAVIGARLQDVRLYQREVEGDEVKQIAEGTRAAWLALRGESLAEKESEELIAWFARTLSPRYREAENRLAELEKERQEILKRGTIAHVMTERAEEAEAFILHRGEYDQRRDRVTPDVPQSLPSYPEDFPRNRLGLARWLLQPGHPLTARVTVNRFWQEVFGVGIVASSGDFGITGQLPSNQDLLDWLAVEFRESGWNVKQFFRLMLTSATYRQSAEVTERKLETDAKNEILSRGPRFRMDAEMIRDFALSASGLLVRDLGGPSVKPYQPDGVWEAVAMRGSNTRDYKQDQGSKLYRRSMYTFWKRSAPPASMDLLNAPNRETCTVRRERTNTPLQALLTLNDPQFIEAARHLATMAIHESTSPASRVDIMARRLMSRPLSEAESSIVQTALGDFLQHYAEDPQGAQELLGVGASPLDASVDRIELAAYTMLANQLLNLDEVLNK